MNHKLKRGQALVITGPEGCGKTTLARQIAALHGSYEEIDAGQLEGPFAFETLLKRNPRTLIVDGLPKNEELVRTLITSDQIQVNRRYQPPVVFKDMPNLIVCSGQLDWIKSNDRRFFVIDLGAKK